MGRRWKWFLRQGSAAVDLTGQVVPDGGVPGSYRWPSPPEVVSHGRVTWRCDGALVYERTVRRRMASMPNQRANCDDPQPSGEHHDLQRRRRGTAKGVDHG